MYTFSIPMDFSPNTQELVGGQVYTQQFNLSQAQYTTMTGCSIHAVANSPVNVEVWMANIPKLPFIGEDLNSNWISPIGDLWVPCNSIPTFTVKPQENFFQQFDFTDVCTFLLFRYLAAGLAATKKADFALKICFK